MPRTQRYWCTRREDWKSLCDVGADQQTQSSAPSGIEGHGDLEQAFAGCTHVIEQVYHTKANQQAMMETFRAYTHLDVYGRLNVVATSADSVPYQKNPGHALDIAKSRIPRHQAQNRRGDSGQNRRLWQRCTSCHRDLENRESQPKSFTAVMVSLRLRPSPRHEMERYG